MIIFVDWKIMLHLLVSTRFNTFQHVSTPGLGTVLSKSTSGLPSIYITDALQDCLQGRSRHLLTVTWFPLVPFKVASRCHGCHGPFVNVGLAHCITPFHTFPHLSTPFHKSTKTTGCVPRRRHRPIGRMRMTTAPPLVEQVKACQEWTV